MPFTMLNRSCEARKKFLLMIFKRKKGTFILRVSNGKTINQSISLAIDFVDHGLFQYMNNFSKDGAENTLLIRYYIKL